MVIGIIQRLAVEGKVIWYGGKFIQSLLCSVTFYLKVSSLPRILLGTMLYRSPLFTELDNALNHTSGVGHIVWSVHTCHDMHTRLDLAANVFGNRNVISIPATDHEGVLIKI